MADLPRLIDDDLDVSLVIALAKSRIPQDTSESLMDYIRHGVPCGSFLTAVLENDLYKSFGRADASNHLALAEIVSFLVHKVPHTIWGSPLAVSEWIARGAKARDERELSTDEAAQALGSFVAGNGGAK